MEIWLDGTKVYTVNQGRLSKAINMTPGAHRLTVQAGDQGGRIFKSTIYLTAK